MEIPYAVLRFSWQCNRWVLSYGMWCCFAASMAPILPRAVTSYHKRLESWKSIHLRNSYLTNNFLQDINFKSVGVTYWKESTLHCKNMPTPNWTELSVVRSHAGFPKLLVHLIKCHKTQYVKYQKVPTKNTTQIVTVYQLLFTHNHRPQVCLKHVVHFIGFQRIPS